MSQTHCLRVTPQGLWVQQGRSCFSSLCYNSHSLSPVTNGMSPDSTFFIKVWCDSICGSFKHWGHCCSRQNSGSTHPLFKPPLCMGTHVTRWCALSRCPLTQHAWPALQATTDTQLSGLSSKSEWFSLAGPASWPCQPAFQKVSLTKELWWLILVVNLAYLGRDTLNWRTASIRLAYVDC